MLHKDIGVILNGNNEVISVEIESNNKNFYYLRYYRCSKKPKFYTVVATKEPGKQYFHCFQCGHKHPMKYVVKIFIDLFNSIHNLLIYGVGSLTGARNKVLFLEATLKALREGDFQII